MMIEIIHLERLRRERLDYEATQRRRACAVVARPAGVVTLRDRTRRRAIVGCCAALFGGSIISALGDRPLPNPANKRRR
jgi:hypothetical protein